MSAKMAAILSRGEWVKLDQARGSTRDAFRVSMHSPNGRHLPVVTDVQRGLSLAYHDDVIKWKHFPPNWPFVRGIHRSPVNSSHKGQWRGALVFSLICVWINGWVNNREAGDLRRSHAHYDVIEMWKSVEIPTGHVSPKTLRMRQSHHVLRPTTTKGDASQLEAMSHTPVVILVFKCTFLNENV